VEGLCVSLWTIEPSPLNHELGKNQSPAQFDFRDMKYLGRGRPDRDTVLEQCIPGICVEWFPDNEGNTWHIERTAHIDDGTFVLVRLLLTTKISCGQAA